MFTYPVGFYSGVSANIIVVSTGDSRPIKGSKTGVTWNDLGSNFSQPLGSAGGFFGETVKIGSEAFICRGPTLYKTTDFRTFTQIIIQSLPNGRAPLFASQPLLFKDPSYPSRLYASSANSSGPATGLWYSDDLGLNWTTIVSETAGSPVTISNFVIIGSYYYCGISVSGNSSVTLYRFNRANFADNQQVSNTLLPDKPWLYTENNNRLFALNGALVWTDTHTSGGNGVTLPANFRGNCMAGRSIGGSQRQVIVGRRDDTGNLAAIYSNNAPESTWSYGSVPTIALASASPEYMKVIALSNSEGFVASYMDSTDLAPSGILYSVDGIAWAAADSGLTKYINIMNNPLII